MREIPLSEYRRAGFTLFFASTPTGGLVVASLLGALLLVATVAVITTAAFVVMVLLGSTTIAADFSSGWLTIPLRGGWSFLEWLGVPFLLVAGLWPAYAVLAAAGAVAAPLERKAFALRTLQERGQPAGNIVARHLPALVFGLVAGIALLFVFRPWQAPSAPFGPAGLMPEGSALAGWLVVVAYAALVGGFLAWLWNGVFFGGLSIYHRLFVAKTDRVDRARIESQFADLKEAP